MRELGHKHLAAVLGQDTGSGDIRARMGVEGNAVLKAIVEGDAASELGAKLARKDMEGSVTAADVEGALRQLGSMVPQSDQPDAAVDGTFQAFRAAFDTNNKKRTLAQVMAGQPKTMDDLMSSVGVDQRDLEKNRALFEQRGQLPEWQELFFALTRDPKNLPKVREILGSKTRSEVEDLGKVYNDKTKGRSLQADLVGADAAMLEAVTWLGGAARESLAERRELMEGGEFETRTEDPVARMAEEGAWLHGRIIALEKRVMDNRGLFAELRDWSGNVEHELVSLAKSDAVAAKKELDRALKTAPAEVSIAAQQIRELRRTKRRLTHAVEAYKASTAAAFSEFVDLAVMVVSTAVTMGQGGFIIMALRTTAARIGTKLALKQEDYSAGEFMGDLQSGLADLAGGAVVSKLYKPMAVSWAERAVKSGFDKTLIGRIGAKVGPMASWEAEEQIESIIGGIVEGRGAGADGGRGPHRGGQAARPGLDHEGRSRRREGRRREARESQGRAGREVRGSCGVRRSTSRRNGRSAAC